MKTQKITNGPGKSDIIFSLFDGKVVKLHLETCQNQQMQISKKVNIVFISLTQEDGSRDKWMFKAVNERDRTTISGYYDSKSRTGHIRLK